MHREAQPQTGVSASGNDTPASPLTAGCLPPDREVSVSVLGLQTWFGSLPFDSPRTWPGTALALLSSDEAPRLCGTGTTARVIP